MKKYKHLFFDWDHTLWDFETNSRETLFELFDEYQLEKELGVQKELFAELYSHYNQQLWKEFDLGRITKDELRKERFRRVLKKLHLEDSTLIEDLDRKYINRCPQKGGMIFFAKEIIEKLAKHYEIHVITNGFQVIQEVKLANSGIDHHIRSLITAEKIGYSKPDRRIFKHALEHVGAQREESLMIGDNLITDIGGARKYNIDQVFFNPSKIVHRHKVTYEVHCLSELEKLLLML